MEATCKACVIPKNLREVGEEMSRRGSSYHKVARFFEGSAGDYLQGRRISAASVRRHMLEHVDSKPRGAKGRSIPVGIVEEPEFHAEDQTQESAIPPGEPGSQSEAIAGLWSLVRQQEQRTRVGSKVERDRATRIASGIYERIYKLQSSKSDRQIDVLSSPEWARLRGVLFGALAAFPEARDAVAKALAALEDESSKGQAA